jgi:c-di-GMP-binding flagellar brake protein YcgR
MGAKFVLQKPISLLNATRCFSAALNFMVRERRRYFRHPVEIPVHLEFGSQEFKATATNLSDGGMAIHFFGNLPKGGLSAASFRLPEGAAVIEAKATLAWVDGEGRAGVRFVELPASSRQMLDGWLSEQLSKMGLPPEDATPYSS